MAVNVSIARRYARALLEVASESAQLDKVSTELREFTQLFNENKELNDLLVNPAYEKGIRSKTLTALAPSLQLSPAVANLLQLLVERNRMIFLPDIQRLFADMADAKSGRVRGQVTSAVPLSDDVVKKIETSLERLTQRDVVLEKKIDPTLIGGVSAQVGSMVIDGSVKNQLEQIRRELHGV